jgi:3-methyladenine DNA glycosylase AlkD
MSEKQITEILNKLRLQSSDKYKGNVVKMGIPEENSIGVSTQELRKIARNIPKFERNKVLSQSLWATGYHEAKILAILIGAYNYNDYSKEEILSFMDAIQSWDLCDMFCKSILIKRKDFNSLIEEFIKSDSLYYKRAGFTLLAAMSTHSVLSDEQVTYYLSLIPTFSIDDRVHVKKAASWALRELGKIDESSKEKSIIVANELATSDNKAQQWIAKDALKELNTLIRVEGRSRLISSKSKMGKEALEKS